MHRFWRISSAIASSRSSSVRLRYKNARSVTSGQLGKHWPVLLLWKPYSIASRICIKARVIGPRCWRGVLCRAVQPSANALILALALPSRGWPGRVPNTFSRIGRRWRGNLSMAFPSRLALNRPGKRPMAGITRPWQERLANLVGVCRLGIADVSRPTGQGILKPSAIAGVSRFWGLGDQSPENG
jgi:hypothetical protein